MESLKKWQNVKIYPMNILEYQKSTAMKANRRCRDVLQTWEALFILSFSAVILRMTAVGVNDKGLEEEADLGC